MRDFLGALAVVLGAAGFAQAGAVDFTSPPVRNNTTGAITATVGVGASTGETVRNGTLIVVPQNGGRGYGTQPPGVRVVNGSFTNSVEVPNGTYYVYGVVQTSSGTFATNVVIVNVQRLPSNPAGVSGATVTGTTQQQNPPNPPNTVKGEGTANTANGYGFVGDTPISIACVPYNVPTGTPRPVLQFPGARTDAATFSITSTALPAGAYFVACGAGVELRNQQGQVLDTHVIYQGTVGTITVP